MTQRPSIEELQQTVEALKAELAGYRRQAADVDDSAELYAKLMATIPDIVVQTDLTGTILDVNQSGLELSGYQRDELVGHNMMLFLAPDDRPKAITYNTLMLEQALGPQEYHLILKDGSKMPFEVNGEVLRDLDGTPLGRVLVCREISDRQRMEAARTQSEQRSKRQRAAAVRVATNPSLAQGEMEPAFRDLTEAAAEALEVQRASVWLVSPDGEDLYCADLFEAEPKKHSSGDSLKVADYPLFFGAIARESRIYSSDVQSDPNTRELWDSYLRPMGITSMLNAGIQAGGRLAGAVCLEHTGDKREWHPDEEAFAGAMASLAAVAVTNAERRRAEEALRRREIQYRGFLEDLPDPCVAYDLDGRVLFLNRQFEKIFGWERDELLGQRLDFVPQEAKVETLNAVISMLRGERVEAMDSRRLTKDGRMLSVLVNSSPTLDHEGQLMGNVVILRDVTALEEAKQVQRQSEERYRSIIDNAVLGIYQITQEGAFRMVNSCLARMLGWDSPEDLLAAGVKIRDLYADSAAGSHALAGMGGQGSADIQERRFLRKDGGEFWARIHGRVIQGQDGENVYEGFMVDISDSVLSQQTLRQSEERFRSISDCALDGIVMIDSRGIITFWNPAAEKIFGYSAQEALGQDLHLLVAPKRYHPDYAKAFAQFRHTGMGAAVGKILRLAGIRKGGAEFPIEISVSGLKVGDERCAVGIIRDVSNSEAAQIALRESEERYRSVVENSHEGIIIVDDRFCITYANDEFCRILGLPREESEGRDFRDFLAEDTKQVVVDHYQSRQRGETPPARYEFKVVRSDGTPRWVEIASTVITDYEGKVLTVAQLLDITEQKKANEEKERLETQLRHSQKMEAVGTLAGGIAHDFNNILATIIGFGELAQRAAREERDNSGQLGRIIGAAERARDLVRQLLTFSRRSETELEPVDINHLLAYTIQMLRPTIPKMIDIQIEPDESLELIIADAGQLEQVVMNLASNARDAMPEGGSLVFRTGSVRLDHGLAGEKSEIQPGKYVELTVTDTGRGMAQDTLTQIFDPFFTTKEIGKGTGLGLSTVYGIVKEHGGHISCDSRPDHGTTFHIYLPADKPADKPVAELTPLQHIAPGGDELILLVDDEEAIREMAAEMLREAGYKVIGAANGEDALAVYRDNQVEIDLVVLDLGMPGMGGHKCLQALLDINRSLKVLIASGYSPEGTVKDTVHAGASGYIAKPFKCVDLLETVRNVLDA